MLTTYWFLAINIVIYISANKVYVMLWFLYPFMCCLVCLNLTHLPTQQSPSASFKLTQPARRTLWSNNTVNHYLMLYETINVEIIWLLGNTITDELLLVISTIINLYISLLCVRDYLFELTYVIFLCQHYVLIGHM